MRLGNLTLSTVTRPLSTTRGLPTNIISSPIDEPLQYHGVSNHRPGTPPSIEKRLGLEANVALSTIISYP